MAVRGNSVCVSLTEHFQLGIDRQVTVLYRAGVEALIVVGDIKDLKHPIGEQVNSGIRQKGGGAAVALPGKDTNAHMYPKTHIRKLGKQSKK